MKPKNRSLTVAARIRKTPAMAVLKRRSLALRVLITTVWAIWLGGAPGIAQAPVDQDQRAEQGSADRARRHGLRHTSQPADSAPRGPGHGRFRSRWARPIFEPSREDRGPLQPGEEEELRNFMKQELPGLAQLLRQIDEQHPGAARQGFPRLVPRLRVLRRIHAQNPELAQLVARHAGNFFRLELLRRRWQRASEDERGTIELQMRERLAENVSIEADTLNRWADDLESNRQAHVTKHLAALTESGTDLALEPPEIRGLVEELNAATDEAGRAALASQLATLLGRQLDSQVAAIRRRADELRARGPVEVDARLARLLEPPRPRP